MNRNQFNEALQKLNSSPFTKEVLQLLLNGHTNAEIAKLRGKSEGTIRKQVSNLYKKFGIESQFPGDPSSQRDELKALFEQYKPEWVSDLPSAVKNEVLVEQTAKVAEQEEAIAKPQRASVESDAGSIEERYFRATSNFDSLAPLERKSRIQVLEEIARDSPRYHWKVMEFLAAFIRRKAPRREEEEGEKEKERSPKISEDIQAALTVIGWRNWNCPLNLSNTDIRGADLKKANLQGAKLNGANLQRVDFQGADLQGAFLDSSDLKGASLIGAKLQNAILTGANLQEVLLPEANLQMANLIATDLEGALLRNINMEGALLRRANLQGVFLRAKLKGADLTEADLRGADLSEAKNLDLRQIQEAFGDSTSILPENIARPAHWI